MEQTKPVVLSEALARRVDPKGVRRTYARWPKLAAEGFKSELRLPKERFERACVMGMGGSAAGGDILSGWMAGRGNPELFTWKGGPLTRNLRGTLAIACSASGQTAETIDMLKTAVKHGATVVSISSGGELKDVSDDLGLEHISMPEVVAPRYMLPFMVFACLSVLNRGLHLRCEGEVRNALRSMENEGREIGIAVETPENPSKRLALALLGKNPAIYGTAITRGVGMRFKNVLNENAKRHAYFDRIPDAFHNEIESWEDTSRLTFPVFLRHSLDGERDSDRMDSMVSILESSGIRSAQVKGRGKSSLAQLATLAYRLDMASYYLALANGTDPFPTLFMDRLKKQRLPNAHELG